MGGLDFWIGNWVVTWDGGHGTNVVTLELNERVITERFEALEPEGGRFIGTSLSVLGQDGIWRQTWVDSTGNYWHFEGGPQADGTFVFATPGKVDKDRLYKRMVFSDIAPDEVSWRWEFSSDGSQWEEHWAIAYRRASPSDQPERRLPED